MAKILIIDDDPGIVGILTLHLNEQGHEVSTAQDGMAATTVLMKERPELILLDYNMPAANGATVHARLRAMYQLAKVPVIFLTASPIGDVFVAVKDDPYTRFMEKPIDFTELDKQIASFLPKAAPPPPAAPRAAAPPPRADPDEPEVLDLD